MICARDKCGGTDDPHLALCYLSVFRRFWDRTKFIKLVWEWGQFIKLVWEWDQFTTLVWEWGQFVMLVWEWGQFIKLVWELDQFIMLVWEWGQFIKLVWELGQFIMLVWEWDQFVTLVWEWDQFITLVWEWDQFVTLVWEWDQLKCTTKVGGNNPQLRPISTIYATLFSAFSWLQFLITCVKYCEQSKTGAWKGLKQNHPQALVKTRERSFKIEFKLPTYHCQ